MKSFYFYIRSYVVALIKKMFHISDFTLFIRKSRQRIERLFYHKTYSASDIVTAMVDMGLRCGDTIIVHCAMNNFYNYRGTSTEIIDALLNYLGPEGTLCMPAYPFDKANPNKVFDVQSDKTAAGCLAETFRNYPGVKRSLNKLHSVCAIGKNADFLLSEHHLSQTCFDEKSPFYKLELVGGVSFSLGLPKYYVGTIEHVCESLLREKLLYFKEKFSCEVTFRYINQVGKMISHTMITGNDKKPYIRCKNTNLIDKYFDKGKYERRKLSNIWINMYDVQYTINRLSELALEGKTIFCFPPFYY